MSRSFDALRNAALRERELADQTPIRPTNGDFGTSSVKDVRRITDCPGPKSHITLDSDGKPNTVRERFRYMEHQLRTLRRTAGLKRILVTSSVPREGKTVVACNLAATLACGGERVLLIDADLRGPGSTLLFGLNESAGLGDMIEGRIESADAIVYLEALKVFYLPSGHSDGSPADAVQSSRMQAFLAGGDEFDWVIIDSPPISMFADALSLATQVDGVMLVARSGLTRANDFERSVDALKKCRIAGVVLNGYDKPQENYYSAYYRTKR